jgi:hypothetical protein
LQNLSAVALLLHQAENASKITKDMVLAELLQPIFAEPAPGGSGPSTASKARPHYKIGPITVCRKGMARILGIGKQRAHRLQKGWADQRYGKRAPGDPRNGDYAAYSSIYTHLWHGAYAHCKPNN